ncbi:ribosome hibernation-promoting factor, HPF/YfiA family [Jatrophihabitans endophyticus]
MEIVVRGRNVVVPDHYRQHVEEKLAKLERYDQKIHRTDVELQHEKNPRQNGSCQHVEITCRTRGPVVRSEACAEDFYSALDLAADRLERRLRQAADRRRVHHGRRRPPSVAEATAALADTLDVAPETIVALDGAGGATGPVDGTGDVDGTGGVDGAGEAVDGLDGADGPGQVVREKEHPGTPMSVDEALFEMELVGHDFYLFKCAETGRPTVVYRRHAYDYGLLRLVE